MKHGIVLSLLLLAGCAFTPQEVAVVPQPEAPRNFIAGDQSVILEVIDLRGEKSRVIGYWGKPEKQDAPITTRNDIAESTRHAVAEALGQTGFVIADKAVGAPLKLEVELMTLSYANDYSDWKKIQAKAQAGIYARVKNENAVIYESDYIASDEDRYFIAPNIAENTAHINRALSRALSAMLNDSNLLLALGAVPAPAAPPAETPSPVPQAVPGSDQKQILPVPEETVPLLSPTSL